MTFAEWVKKAFNLEGPSDSALSINIELGAKVIERLNKVKPRLDEESLTGAMIGAFAGTHAISASAYPNDQSQSLQWASYGKNDSGLTGEKETGADFALLLEFPGDLFKLAIFQAKRDANSKAHNNELIVGKLKDITKTVTRVKNGKEVKTKVITGQRNQVKALVQHATAICEKQGIESSLDKLTWVYYLCQHVDGVRAVPLSRIQKQVSHSIKFSAHVPVAVGPKLGISFSDLLLASLLEKSEHWLTLRAKPDGGFPDPIDLTGLLELMPVVVGEGSGASKAIKMGGAMRHELTGVVTAEPTPDVSSKMTFSPTRQF